MEVHDDVVQMLHAPPDLTQLSATVTNISLSLSIWKSSLNWISPLITFLVSLKINT